MILCISCSITSNIEFTKIQTEQLTIIPIKQTLITNTAVPNRYWLYLSTTFKNDSSSRIIIDFDDLYLIDDSNEKLRVEYVSGVKKGFFERNKELKSIWGEQYIDLIELISDSTEKVLIFTPDSKFISYDTYHFTKFGAIYYAHILEDKLLNVMNITK